MAALARLPAGPVEHDEGRALLLELWWFLDKGGLVERREGGARILIPAEPARFLRAAQDLAALLDGIASSGDAAKLRSLLAEHATQADRSLREETLGRLSAAHLAPRAVVLPPHPDGTPVTDLDDEVLHAFDDWVRPL